MADALQRALGASLPLLERLPVAICCCAADGTLFHFNSRAASLWGRAPELGPAAPQFCGAQAIFQMNGARLDVADSPIAEVLRTGEAIADREVIIERPDGSRIAILANVEPLLDEDGRLVGAVNCFQDISRLRAAELQIRDGAKIVTALIDALPAAIYTTTKDGRINFYNRSARDLWGEAPSGDMRWWGSQMLLQPNGAPMPHDESPMALALNSAQAIRGVEGMVARPDGARVPFLSYPTPIFDGEGALVGGVNMLVDITERKAAEERQKVLIDELNHRVKNTLATVQSMAVQCMRDAERPDEAARAFIDRLMALSRTHDLLSYESWSGADLRAILENLAKPYAGRIELVGPAARLTPRAALTLALVLNELATNAVKYGALSAEGGRVSLTWTCIGDQLALDWRERGGPPVSPPRRRSFGTRFIQRGVEHELGGSAHLNFDPAGLQCSLRISLEPAE